MHTSLVNLVLVSVGTWFLFSHDVVIGMLSKGNQFNHVMWKYWKKINLIIKQSVSLD